MTALGPVQCCKNGGGMAMQLWWVFFLACCPCWTRAASGDSLKGVPALRGARGINGSLKPGTETTTLPAASGPTTTTKGSLLQASIQDPSCHCGKFGCACDVSEAAELSSFLLRLGFDRCVDEGSCEACSAAEMQSAPCKIHGKRQRMACAKCGSVHTPASSPACRPHSSAFWSEANGSSRSATEKHSAGTSNASKEGLSTGIFLRSCLAPLKSMSSSSSSSSSTIVHATRDFTPTRSESSEILVFLALNGIVLTFSGFSLRRQQANRLQEALKGLKADPGSTDEAPHRPNSGRGGGDSGAVPEKIGRSSAASERGSPGRGSRDGGILPEKSGRSTLAEAAARAGTAIELAVTGSEHKTK